MPVHDLIVRAGRVVSGLATSPHTADIAVRDGVIAAIGRVKDRAHRVIDADGALVIPGVVALLPPAEVAEFERNRQHHLAPGVTTTIEELPPSVEIDDVARFYRKSVGGPFLVDRGFLLPHDAIRQRVMGNKTRDHLAPSVGDLERMVDLFADGLIAGALGLHSKLEGELDELQRLLRATVEQLTLRTETDATTTVVLNAQGRESGELLEVSRSLADVKGIGAVVVATDEPLDDDRVVSAIRPPAEGAPPAELPPESQIIAGPGLNPLGLVRELDTARGDIQPVALRWATMARSFGLHDRGIIATDRRADLNVLDHVHLNNELTDGLVSTLVAGNEIVSFNELTGTAPGRIVSRSVVKPD